MKYEIQMSCFEFEIQMYILLQDICQSFQYISAQYKITASLWPVTICHPLDGI